MSWREFWNNETSLYANERHRLLHDEAVARDVAALVESPQDVVLDYGCGPASSASLVALACAHLYLYDPAPTLRQALQARFAGSEKITVLEAEGIEGTADSSLDLIVINSVLQYVPQPEFEALLDRARVKLKPNGRLVAADILPVGAGAGDDVAALLKFAAQGGFLIAALGSLVTTFFSDYRKLRSQVGLMRYSEEGMIALFAAHGFRAVRAPHNIGHNQSRMMFVARPVAG